MLTKLKLFFTLFFILIISPYSLQAQGSCDFGIEATVTPVDCRANGIIEVTLTGNDLVSMSDFYYRVYPTGNNPDDYPYVKNSTFYGLAEGNYTIDAKGYCTLNGLNIAHSRSNVAVSRIAAHIEPDFTVNENLGRKSFSCIPTGLIHLQGLKVGKGPYTLKFLSFPAEYTENPIIEDNVASLAPSYQIEGLPAGTYVIELSDGCGSAIERTTTVEELSSDYWATMIKTPFYADPNAKDGDCNKLSFFKDNPTDSKSDWHYYVTNATKFYEYAIYHKGDDVDNLTWNALTNSGSYASFNSIYTLAEMRADKEKLPKVYVRVKGGNCTPYVYSPAMNNSGVISSVKSIDCDTREYVFGVGTKAFSSNGAMICYPYTWKITEVNTSTSVTSNTFNSTAPRYSGDRDSIFLVAGNTYHLEVTASDGTILVDTKIVDLPVPAVEVNTIRPHACNEVIALYLKGASLQGATIEYVPEVGLSGRQIVPPLHTRIEVPKNYTGSVYPYSTDYTKNSFFPSINIPTEQVIKFLVTDTCGNSKIFSYTGIYSFAYAKNPELEVSASCDRAIVKSTDLNQIYKRINTRTDEEAGGGEVYMKVIASPAGADIVYSRTAGYLKSSSLSDYVQLSKSGVYRFQIASDSFFSSVSCFLEFDVDIQIPEMAIDEATTAAYRCPGSLVGTGYMDIKVKNGSGNYLFTLYSQNDPSVVLATSTTGIFTSWAASTSDYYTVKVEDKTCGRTMTHNIYVYDLGNAIIGWPEDEVYTKCSGDDIKLYALSLGETTYSWEGPNGWTSTQQNPIINGADPDDHSGVYTITVSVPGCGGATVSQSFTLSVAHKIMYWNPMAVDNNWYNIANWLVSETEPAKSVPAACTTVHIAGNSNMYPNLDKDVTPRNVYGLPACDTIIFHYGSETIYPHFLKYNNARIQYNVNYYDVYSAGSQPYESKDENEYPQAVWGEPMPVMQRSQWYMISAPLKHITGGDFGLGGYPNTYQRLYNTKNPELGQSAKDDFTISFNTQNIPLESTGHAMALWVPNYDTNYIGLGDHKHLEALQGVFEMPYFENTSIMEHRPLHRYDDATSTSYFQYYASNLPTLDPINQWDEYQRGKDSYRFVYENVKDTVDILTINGSKVAGYELKIPDITSGSTTRRVMIGNPLMCHIDFDKIVALNSGVIEDFYMVVDGASGTFENYRTGGGSIYGLTNQIPPLQAFIVTIKDNPTDDKILLPFEGANSIITPDSNGDALPKPRRAEVTKASGWLNITASTPPKEGVVATNKDIITRATLRINESFVDIPKVVFPSGLDTKAEIFFIGENGNLNAEQVSDKNPELIKFGVESLYKDDITLNFKKEANAAIEKVILVDKHLNVSHDVSENGIYTFKHRHSLNGAGLDKDRFELRLTYAASGILESGESPVVIFVNRSSLHIESESLISLIKMHDSSGKQLLLDQNLSTTKYTKDMVIEPGVYVATVLLENNKILTQKIVVQ